MAIRGCWSSSRARMRVEASAPGLMNEAIHDMQHNASVLTKPHARNRFLSTGFKLIGYTFVLHFGLHLMTFTLNGLAYRWLDTLSIGLVNVRIGLFYSTLMFISRDAFRRAILSRGGELVTQMQSPKDGAELKASGTASTLDTSTDRSPSLARFAGLIDLAWTILPLGIVLAVLLLMIWIWILPSPGALAKMHNETILPLDVLQSRYIQCLLVYTISGLFELATEPFWLVCQLIHLVRERIFIEAFANCMRALGIVVAIFIAPRDCAIYSLAFPQILHGTSLFICYIAYFSYNSRKFGRIHGIDYSLEGIEKLRDLFPRIANFAVDRPAFKLATNLFGQGVLKQALTEGERYIISAFNLLSFSDQGIYDLVNNIGSIAARLLFLPMEESCHFVFNQCLVRDVLPHLQDTLSLENVFRMLHTVLRMCSLIAWIGVTFAQANSRLLLTVYAGPVLATNPTAHILLRLYAIYVILLAWNGSTESFVNAAMSSIEVTKHNRRLLLFSIVFLCANWFLVPLLGAHGFVVANCINMLCRILYSCFYITHFVRSVETCHRRNSDSSMSLTSEESTVDAATSNEEYRPHIRHFSLLRLMFPSFKESAVLLLSLMITVFSEWHFCCSSGLLLTMLHAAITGFVLLATLCVMAQEESDLIRILQTDVFYTKRD